MNIAIIPARGGSKRIPRKNIKSFQGQPVIRYAIEVAVKSGLFEEVMVSTDDEEIVKIAKYYGASVPFLRKDETANDYATLDQVIREVVCEYNKRDIIFKNYCCMLPANPFVTISYLKEGFELLLTGLYDSVRVVQQFSYPIQRAYRKKSEYFEYIQDRYAKARSQDLEVAYHDAGMFYWIKGESLDDNKKWGGLVISEMESHDIDTIEDWSIAEIKYKVLKELRKDEN